MEGVSLSAGKLFFELPQKDKKKYPPDILSSLENDINSKMLNVNVPGTERNLEKNIVLWIGLFIFCVTDPCPLVCNFLLRQLREQAKKLASTKRNQQIERERHAGELSKMKQELDDSDGKHTELKVNFTLWQGNQVDTGPS